MQQESDAIRSCGIWFESGKIRIKPHEYAVVGDSGFADQLAGVEGDGFLDIIHRHDGGEAGVLAGNEPGGAGLSVYQGFTIVDGRSGDADQHGAAAGFATRAAGAFAPKNDGAAAVAGKQRDIDEKIPGLAFEAVADARNDAAVAYYVVAILRHGGHGVAEDEDGVAFRDLELFEVVEGANVFLRAEADVFELVLVELGAVQGGDGDIDGLVRMGGPDVGGFNGVFGHGVVAAMVINAEGIEPDENFGIALDDTAIGDEIGLVNIRLGVLGFYELAVKKAGADPGHGIALLDSHSHNAVEILRRHETHGRQCGLNCGGGQ